MGHHGLDVRTVSVRRREARGFLAPPWDRARLGRFASFAVRPAALAVGLAATSLAAISLAATSRAGAGRARPATHLTSAPDPRPYDLVLDHDGWEPAGRAGLEFCLLGLRGERRARVVAVYEESPRGYRPVFVDRERGFHPWRIAIAELDGDSLPEVLVGVYKKSRFDPTPRTRLFVFDWTEDGTLFPKWLGSNLGAPFDDFVPVSRPNGRGELLTWERRARGNGVLRLFSWNGFGFNLESMSALTPHPGRGPASRQTPRSRLLENAQKLERAPSPPPADHPQ